MWVSFSESPIFKSLFKRSRFLFFFSEKFPQNFTLKVKGFLWQNLGVFLIWRPLIYQNYRLLILFYPSIKGSTYFEHLVGTIELV